MTFSVAPAGFPTPSVEEFPRFIQFRWNGVDLGGPDATVVDFVGDGWVVTRGTGDDADKITVSLE